MRFMDIIDIILKIPGFLVAVTKILEAIKIKKDENKRETAELLAENSADSLT